MAGAAGMVEAEQLPSVADVYTQSTIMVKVGEEGKQYHLHPLVVRACSGYFNNLLEPTANEAYARAQPVILNGVDPATFEGFVVFAYATCNTMPYIGTIGLMKAFIRNSEPGKSPNYKIAEYYVFAHRVHSLSMKSVLIYITYKSPPKALPLYEEISYTFEHLPIEDPYLQLLVDQQADLPEASECVNQLLNHTNGMLKSFWTLVRARLDEVQGEPGMGALRPLPYYDAKNTEPASIKLES